MKHKPELYFLVGLWFSFISILLAGGTLLPTSKDLAQNSPALLYKIAMNEELKRPINLPEAGKIIGVDLTKMELTLMEDGKLIKTFSILSRGKEGTAWETPTGKYAIQTKELKHFSTIGRTWMPYSMEFYGNFFIHGWPTYQNGADVPVGYSGGCIRLSTEDAHEVYTFASLGTRVVVTGAATGDLFATSSRYYLHSAYSVGMDTANETALPTITAASFLVGDLTTGDILWERNKDEHTSPGPLVSMLTALTAIETVDQYKLVRMGELLLGKSTLRKQSSGAPDEVPVGALVYPLIFDGNDTAAKVFEREHGVKKFVAYMNEKSQAIGMDDSVFGGGLSKDTSTTTARDLFLLLQYVQAHKHFLIDVSLATERTIENAQSKERYYWENKNPWIMSGDGAYRGGIGTKESDGSGSGMLLFSLPVSEFGDRTIAIVILGSTDTLGDVSALKQFVMDRFVYGIEREAEFLREGNEPTPSLLKQAEDLLRLEKLLHKEVLYERDV